MDLQDHEEAFRRMVEYPVFGMRAFEALNRVYGALAEYCPSGDLSVSCPVREFSDEALARIIFSMAPKGTLISLCALMDSEEFEEEAEEEFEGEE